MMARRRVVTVVPAVLLAVLATPLTEAAEDVLSVVPEGALGYAVVHRLAETDAKARSLGEQTRLPVPSLLAMLKEKTGVKKGLDENGSAALVVMPAGAGRSEPVQMLVVPVTDYGQFIEQFDPDDASAKIAKVRVMDGTYLVGSDGGYAVFADPEDRDVLEKALAEPNRISPQVAPMQQWLAENDVAVVVTRRGIELLSVKGQQALRDVKEALSAMGEDVEPAVALFGVYEEILRAAGEEIRLYAAGVRVDQQGAVHVTDWTLVTPGGQADKMISEIQPPQRDLLAGLPAGPFVAAGAGAMPKGLTEALADFSVSVMKAAPKLYGLEDEQAAKLAEISRRSMKGIRGMSMLLGVGKPGESLLSSMVVVLKVDDSDAYLANYRETVKAMNELVKDAETSVLTTTELKDVQVGDVSALKISMKYPVSPQAQEMPGYEEMMKAFFGPEGKIVAYLAAADEHTLVTAYTSKKLLRQCLRAVKRPKTGVSREPGLAETAALLPPGAQWVGYWSPQGTVDFINRIVPAFAPKGQWKLPEFAATPPIGFAAKTTPAGVRTYLIVPPAVVKAVGQYVVEVQKGWGEIQRELESGIDDLESGVDDPE